MDTFNLIWDICLSHKIIFYLALVVLNTLAAYMFYHKFPSHMADFFLTLLSSFFWAFEVVVVFVRIVTYFAPYNPFAQYQ